ncbi:MAG TPA: error-prone DNA polymerase [Planctomycetaceae bacterium]|nr:error-prone DNA polymerase [Planctomycetaceae bacterium]
MPEGSLYPKRTPQRASATQSADRAPAYAELHCRTNFSFLEGASHADELVARAVELGYSSLAITDRNSLAGVVRAHAAAKQTSLQLILGAEVVPTDGLPICLLATDRAAYGNLSRLLTVGRRRAEKGACHLSVSDIADYQAGLIGCVVPPHVDHPTLDASADTYREIFTDRCYLFAELHYGANDQQRLARLRAEAARTNLPLVAAGDVYHHVRERQMLQHVLTAIKQGTTVDRLGEHSLPNAERHLRTRAQIAEIFAEIPEAMARTLEISARCQFSLHELRYEYPKELAPAGENPMEYLTRLAWDGARKQYAGEVPEKVQMQLQHELALIDELGYEAFFLTVYDIVQFARSRNILCQGRGSAANSTVCYCLEVTAVDPMSTQLLFERFISRERNEAPDIDVDFEHERREEVLQYIYSKYGRERAGLAAEVITYRPRSAIRDVGKALGLSLDRVDVLAKNIDHRSEHTVLADRCQQSGIDPQSRIGKQLIHLVNEIVGFPRHLGQHVGGMVITRGALCELVPIENAAMADRTVIQWDKDDLQELGMLKVDCLSLGMLTAIHKCFDLIEQHGGDKLTLECIDDADPDVYAMISRAETIGVFQIESRAQMSMLPRLRPKRFYDLVIEVAIVRPGPIQGNMVHPYLRRRNGEEEVRYPNDDIRRVLERTLGVPLFQEQAMQLAVVAAGFTPGEADQLRKSMGAWRRTGVLERFREKMLNGMRARGYTDEFADRLFQQICGFGEYGFPESHAASFAKLAYVSAWLRYHHQAAFTAALINSQPMGFYAPSQLIRDALGRDDQAMEVRPVDVNFSDWDCTLEALANTDSGFAIRLGFRLVRGFSESQAEQIVAARTKRFETFDQFVSQTRLGRQALDQLAEADAFQSLGLNRRQALWQALAHDTKPRDLPLFDQVVESVEPPPELPQLSEQEEVYADYWASGLSLRQHPLSFHRQELQACGVVTNEALQEIRTDAWVAVAGLVLMRQRPQTAKGITFVTIEDETGTANLVLHPAVFQRHDAVARKSAAIIAHGRLERKNEVTHVIVQRLADMSDQLGELRQTSRDFR